MHYLDGADLSPIVGLIVGGLLYSLTTLSTEAGSTQLSHVKPTSMMDAVLEEPRVSYGSVTVPKRLLGCWDRRYIRFSDGTEDTSTRVIWVQTLSGVGDIRIPATRPDLRARNGLADCSKEELLALAEQDCFCGVTLFNSKAQPFPTASWPKESYLFRFQPVITFPEPGWMEWLEGGTCMIERAPSGAYVEDWRLQPGSQGIWCSSNAA